MRGLGGEQGQWHRAEVQSDAAFVCHWGEVGGREGFEGWECWCVVGLVGSLVDRGRWFALKLGASRAGDDGGGRGQCGPRAGHG